MLDPLTPQARGPLTDYSDRFDRSEMKGYLSGEGVDVVSCPTADWTQVEALLPLKGVHVIRDPRDIIVSAYFSHRNSHPIENLPHLAAHRKRLKAVEKDEGLFLEMEFSAQEMEDLYDWNYGHPDILEMKMEELTAQPYAGFLKIFDFLGLLRWDDPPKVEERVRLFARTMLNRLSTRHRMFEQLRKPIPVTGSMLLGRVYDNRFEKRAGGRSKGEEKESSHYRKGASGDWTNHFTEAHVATFKEQFDDIVVKLGYEEDNYWEVTSAAGQTRLSGN